MNLPSVIRLLIIDDKPANLSLISSFFEETEYFIRTSTSLEETLEICKEIEFDLILLDVRMPVDGFVVCSKIRTVEKNSRTPVIFMAEKTDHQNISKAFKMGCRDVITKPFQLDELLSKISTHSLLQIHYRQIKELMEAKDKIFSIIGHDLRSPFNSLIGFSELLLDNLKKTNNTEGKEFAEIINRVSVKNLELLDNLLIYAKDLHKEAQSSLEKINIHSLISDVIQVVQPSASLKSINLLQISGDTKEIYGIKDLIATMIRNIVSNAIKFTPREGSVSIKTNVVGEMLEIDISDSGIGMDEDILKNLFNINNFSRSGTEGEMGTGYGLLLSKEIVVKHKGNISVKSTVGKGSSFIIHLPVYVKE